MWIMTPLGFFSIVQANRDELMVRARASEDLVRLIAELRDFDDELRPELRETLHADYPFRIIVPREPFAAWFASVLLTIDYTNFKDEVAKTDPLRAHRTYLEIWSVLRNDLDPRRDHDLG
jgi:hypothetical protein